MPRPTDINPKTGKRYDYVPPEKRGREKDAELEAINQQIALLERQQMVLEARERFMPFVKFTSPDAEDPNDVKKSRYKNARHHDAIARVLEEVGKGQIPFLILCMPPRHGKEIADDEPVVTPDGWRRHGDLRPGDYVFHPSGRPTKVLAVAQPNTEKVRVRFSNGASVRCHPNHEWTVFDRACGEWRTLEARQMAERALRNGPETGRGGRWTLQLPDTAAIQFSDNELPLDPYVLGAWLGDGTEGGSIIAHDGKDSEVVDAIAAAGFAVSKRYVQPRTGVHYARFGRSGLTQALRAAGVFTDKHIPESYLRASVQQRLELLAGLVDTDGHVEARTGRVRFSTCSEKLRDGVYDLATTLGFRPYVAAVDPALSSSGIQGCKTTWQVGFQPTVALPTRVPRKRTANFAVRRRIGVVAVEPCEPASGRCIQVDSPDGLYLVGRACLPTHNSELVSRRFPAWFAGRHPEQNVVVSTYNDDFAMDFGAEVRSIMGSPQFKQVFPEVRLRRGGNAKDRLQTAQGGLMVFVGRGGSLTGRGGHVLIVDDLIKDDKEASSQAIRDQAWNWLTKVAMTRRMGKKLVIMTFTRWHSDDPIGRLTDPENPHYSEKLARKIKIINLPAIAEENDPLGRAPGDPLWPDGPDRFDLDFLHEQQDLDPLGFAALYQQRPSVADGVLFRRENIRTYRPEDLPSELRIYAASDHAVGTKQRNDCTVLLTAGVDRQNNIYLLDCWWDKKPTDVVVEAMLEVTRHQKPLLWWAEQGHITKSIGPFLRKRMQETETYINIREVTPVADKEQRAQSIAARVGMGKVYFPKNAVWAEKAINEMLAFPNGLHDDFVDALAYIGLGLTSQVPANAPKKAAETPKFGTLGWVKWSSKWREQQDAAKAAGGF
ncbi:MAG: phage terminase large subunit [Magnetospirillum gryphiswaldense]|nr:phage terminase large subunit [Magnetospirillum gryphiswaldense]